jgi:hypothetical protein
MLRNRFRSLAWQYRTRLPYFTNSSDIDLLWSVHAEIQTDVLSLRICGGRLPYLFNNCSCVMMS